MRRWSGCTIKTAYKKRCTADTSRHFNIKVKWLNCITAAQSIYSNLSGILWNSNLKIAGPDNFRHSIVPHIRQMSGKSVYIYYQHHFKESDRMIRYRRMSAPFVLSLSAVFLSFTAADAEEPFTAYLFAYFTGNSKSQEAIRFATSDDAHTFKTLNKGNPVLSSAKISSSGGVRDPHILRGENNDYYMVATDMLAFNGWASNHGIVMLKSTNLIDWESSTVDIRAAFTQYKAADRVWAPQVIYDDAAGRYMVYFAMRLGSNDRDKIYYAYADSTFTKLETAPKLLYKYGNNSAIDADIIRKDSTFHLFFKTEGSGNGIKSALSGKLTEGYVLFDKYLQVTGAQVEGSCVFRLIDSDTYILMYDMYTSGKYEFAVSTDLKNFTKDPEPISFDFTPRHGTVIPITAAEKNALFAKWNPTAVASRPGPPGASFNCRITGTTLGISFGKNMPDRGVVTVLNSSGKTVLRRDVRGGGATAKIRMTAFPAGVYHIVYRDFNGNRTSALIAIR